MNKANIRLAHELANNSYSVLAYWCANLATTALLLVFCLPGVAIAYFMMGFPGRAFPVMMLNAWMVSTIDCIWFSNRKCLLCVGGICW